MKTASPELEALLNSDREFRMLDCYTITTPAGPVLRYTAGDVGVVLDGNTFSANGPLISRGAIRTMVGLEVDTLNLTIHTADPAHTLNGLPFIDAALDGALDGATVLLQRAFFDDWAAAAVGALTMFSGRVAQLSGSRHELQLTVKSDLELLDVKLPRNLYTPGCSLTLYSAPCGVNRAAVAVTGSVSGVSDPRRAFTSSLAQAAGWGDLGVITFTSGANAGVSRTVRAHGAGGAIDVALAWPADVAAGDAFSIVPGCDKRQATCQGKFNNLVRFRGFPFVPAPETTT